MAFVWGSTFVLVKNALLDCGPQLFNAIRFSLAAIVLIVLYRRHLAGISRRTVFSGMLVGVFLAAGYMFQNAGLRLTTPSKSAFLNLCGTRYSNSKILMPSGGRLSTR